MISVLLPRIASHICSLGFGAYGINVFAGTMPTTPYVCLGIFSTGGYSKPRDPLKLPSLQIAYRTTSVASGISLISSLNNALTEGTTIMCDFPGFFEQQGDPGPHYVDGNNHFVFTLNYVYRTTKLG